MVFPNRLYSSMLNIETLKEIDNYRLKYRDASNTDICVRELMLCSVLHMINDKISRNEYFNILYITVRIFIENLIHMSNTLDHMVNESKLLDSVRSNISTEVNLIHLLSFKNIRYDSSLKKPYEHTITKDELNRCLNNINKKSYIINKTMEVMHPYIHDIISVSKIPDTITLPSGWITNNTLIVVDIIDYYNYKCVKDRKWNGTCIQSTLS